MCLIFLRHSLTLFLHSSFTTPLSAPSNVFDALFRAGVPCSRKSWVVLFAVAEIRGWSLVKSTLELPLWNWPLNCWTVSKGSVGAVSVSFVLIIDWTQPSPGDEEFWREANSGILGYFRFYPRYLSKFAESSRKEIADIVSWLALSVCLESI